LLSFNTRGCTKGKNGSMHKVIKIQIIKGPSGEKGTAILTEKDFISFAPSEGKNEFIPLAKIMWVDLTGGGTKMRKFEMRLRDGRSFECSMSKQDYGGFIKKVPVKR
jgi:hypothetical protein